MQNRIKDCILLFLLVSAFDGLGTMWGKELAVNKLTEAGFKDIKVKDVEGDIMNYYYVSRK